MTECDTPDVQSRVSPDKPVPEHDTNTRAWLSPPATDVMMVMTSSPDSAYYGCRDNTMTGVDNKFTETSNLDPFGGANKSWCQFIVMIGI